MNSRATMLLKVLIMALGLLLLSSCSAVSSEELAEKREEISRYENTVYDEAPGVVVCSPQGTVQHRARFESFPEMATWENIVQVASPEDTCFVGLRSDGTCLSTGSSKSGAHEVSGWTDIVQIVCGSEISYGLRSDGTILIAGGEPEHNAEIETWTQVKKIFTSRGWTTLYALTEDGRVLCSYEDYFKDWPDVVSFNYCRGESMGIKADGSVVLDTHRDGFKEQVSEWTDIVETAMSGSGLYAGLQSDGKVVVAASMKDSEYPRKEFRDKDLKEVSSWRDVVHIEADDELLIGLTYDGEVLFAGNAGDYTGPEFREFDYGKVVFVHAGTGFILLKEDGTLDGFSVVDLKEFLPLW